MFDSSDDIVEMEFSVIFMFKTEDIEYHGFFLARTYTRNIVLKEFLNCDWLCR